MGNSATVEFNCLDLDEYRDGICQETACGFHQSAAWSSGQWWCLRSHCRCWWIHSVHHLHLTSDLWWNGKHKWSQMTWEPKHSEAGDPMFWFRSLQILFVSSQGPMVFVKCWQTLTRSDKVSYWPCSTDPQRSVADVRIFKGEADPADPICLMVENQSIEDVEVDMVSFYISVYHIRELLHVTQIYIIWHTVWL